VVVDDHRDVALAIEFALEAMGHEAHSACDAPTALRALAS
jgi:CheY-like chemotaxis protein